MCARRRSMARRYGDAVGPEVTTDCITGVPPMAPSISSGAETSFRTSRAVASDVAQQLRAPVAPPGRRREHQVASDEDPERCRRAAGALDRAREGLGDEEAAERADRGADADDGRRVAPRIARR